MTGKCSVCKTPILSPVCVLCLTDEVETWIEKNKVSLVKEYRNEVQSIISKIRPKQLMTCSVCRSQATSNLCPVCFAESVFNWLNKSDKKLAINFAKDFKKNLQQMAPSRELFA